MIDTKKAAREFAVLWLAILVAANLLTSCGSQVDVTNDPERDEPLESAQQELGAVRWPIGQQSSPGAADYLNPTTCYHVPGSGAHKPGGGYQRADELYALDLNCASGSEGGKAVYPIVAGTVREVDRTGLGFVLIEHGTSIVVDGVTWTRFFTGSMHMAQIPSGIMPGTVVNTSTKIGVVSSTGAGSAVHLHFVVYVGTPAGEGGATTNGGLISFNPALLGGPFAPFDYVSGGYVWSRWVDDAQSSGAFQFLKFGTAGDLFSSTACGIRGKTAYTTSKTGAAENRFEFKFNVPTPSGGGYYVWPFVPRCSGTTTTAPYTFRAGTNTGTSNQPVLKSWGVNQNALSDQYDRRPKITVPANLFSTVTVTDATGEIGKKVAADQAIIFRKMDHCVGGCSYAPSSERGYCLQLDYSSSTGSSSCTTTTTVSAGY